ncbi:lysR-family transcriptional regulator [Vibrio ishigakensis]|uniref:LysR-family transcriptional regulator n=1 Tax=Vibrio ishigakensis TaxID=1481914 RepID=A0A0B8P8C1_9VIBR|nr:LysR family transcriptional regulator [Vibrio ishigakensis]GAM59438.1 lysR-family transcriptional regulator [Vibrio ishigakensis]
MNLRQLEVFYSVMKAGTVSGAARQLHVSQPNVTRILSHTETQLGFPLFERVKGRLIPTKEALLLAPEAEKVYQQLGQFKNLTNRIKAGEKHLIIGAPPILATSLLAPVVAKACKASDYTIEISTGNQDELCDALTKDQLDLAICFGNNAPSPLVQQTLLESEMKLLTPTQYQDQSSVSLENLLKDKSPLIGLDNRDPLGIQLQQAIQTIAPDFHPQITARNYSTAAELVANGAGYAVVDPWTAEQYQHRVNNYPLSPAIKVEVSLLYPEHRPLSITARWFVEQLQDSL